MRGQITRKWLSVVVMGASDGVGWNCQVELPGETAVIVIRVCQLTDYLNSIMNSIFLILDCKNYFMV